PEVLRGFYARNGRLAESWRRGRARNEQAYRKSRGGADKRETVRPSQPCPWPGAEPPPAASERVVEQLQAIVGDRLRRNRGPHFPQEPHGKGEQQQATPRVERRVQYARLVCGAFTRLADGRGGIAIREIEHGHDAGRSVDDQGNPKSQRAEHEHPYPDFPHG